MDPQQQPEEIIEIKATAAVPEDISWIEYQRRESQQTLQRLEDAAKFLSGLASISLTIMLAPNREVFSSLGDLPLLRIGIVGWLSCLVISLAVIFPFRYRYISNSAGSIRKVHKKIVTIKFRLLLCAALLYLAGISIIAYIYFFHQAPLPK